MPRTTPSHPSVSASDTSSWAPVIAGVPLGTWVVTCIGAFAAVVAHVQPSPDACTTTDQRPCTKQADVALQEVATTVAQLAERIAENKSAVEGLHGAVELAALHRRLSDAELLSRLSTASCEVERHPPSRKQVKCANACEKDAAVDTMGPCVQREKVGEVSFRPGGAEYVDDQKGEVARIAKRIRGELRYVFAVGYADVSAFSWDNSRLALKRARAIATALREELDLGEDAPDSNPIRAVSGVDWAPTTVCSPSQQGKVDVYLLWHGTSPLCTAG